MSRVRATSSLLCLVRQLASSGGWRSLEDGDETTTAFASGATRDATLSRCSEAVSASRRGYCSAVLPEELPKQDLRWVRCAVSTATMCGTLMSLNFVSTR